MTNAVPSFIQSLNKRVKEIQPLLYITRDVELQQGAIESLAQFAVEVADEKAISIKSNQEEYANALLGCECIIGALQAELRMWILLKQEEPDKAWDQLIAAQIACMAAARAHDGFGGASSQLWRRLDRLEHLMFPPQTFMSSGLILEEFHCSICEEDYEDCSHIRGLPYMGQFCRVVITKAKVDHVSLVDSPKDKRCRVLLVGVEGGMRSQMTWLIGEADSDDAPTEAIETKGRISPDEDMRRLKGKMLSLDDQA